MVAIVLEVRLGGTPRPTPGTGVLPRTLRCGPPVDASDIAGLASAQMFARLLLLIAIAFGLVAGVANGRAGCVVGAVEACHCCADPAGASCCDVPQGPLHQEPAAAVSPVDAKQVPAPALILLGLQPQLAVEPPRIRRQLAARMPVAAILDRICVRLI